MSDITFYRQKRFDGGLRTGIDIDGVEYWHDYVSGQDDSDSGIIWFMDVRLAGPVLPDDPDEAHRWLVEHAFEITSALREFSVRYELGLDAGPYPQRWRIKGFPEEIEGEIVVSAANRVQAREFGQLLNQLADEWQVALTRLHRMSRIG